MKKLATAAAGLAFALSAMVSTPVLAEPTSPRVLITSIRPYKSGTAPIVFLYVTSPAICDTTVFKIELADPVGPAMLSVALTAMTAKKYVTLEVSNATGCTGTYTLLQSISIIDN